MDRSHERNSYSQSGSHYDRAYPDRTYERTYDQPLQAGQLYRSEPQRQPESTYRESPGYSGEPTYSRPNEDPYRTQRSSTYNSYEQPHPSPSQRGSPFEYKTQVNTSRSGRMTTTFKAEPIPIGEGLRLNPGYFKTCPGIIKIIQIILGMICLGFSTPALTGCARFFLFVTATCYIMTVLLCIIIILGVDRALHQIPWKIGELVYTSIAAVCFALASILILADIASYDWPGADYRAIRDQYIGAGLFGLVQAVAYAVGLFLLFIDWKATRPVPPPRTITTN